MQYSIAANVFASFINGTNLTGEDDSSAQQMHWRKDRKLPYQRLHIDLWCPIAAWSSRSLSKLGAFLKLSGWQWFLTPWMGVTGHTVFVVLGWRAIYIINLVLKPIGQLCKCWFSARDFFHEFNATYTVPTCSFPVQTWWSGVPGLPVAILLYVVTFVRK